MSGRRPNIFDENHLTVLKQNLAVWAHQSFLPARKHVWDNGDHRQQNCIGLVNALVVRNIARSPWEYLCVSLVVRASVNVHVSSQLHYSQSMRAIVFIFDTQILQTMYTDTGRMPTTLTLTLAVTTPLSAKMTWWTACSILCTNRLLRVRVGDSEAKVRGNNLLFTP